MVQCMWGTEMKVNFLFWAAMPIGQPSMATPTEEEDTRPKVLICGEWRKVPDGYPADASATLERD